MTKTIRSIQRWLIELAFKDYEKFICLCQIIQRLSAGKLKWVK